MDLSLALRTPPLYDGHKPCLTNTSTLLGTYASPKIFHLLYCGWCGETVSLSKQPRLVGFGYNYVSTFLVAVWVRCQVIGNLKRGNYTSRESKTDRITYFECERGTCARTTTRYLCRQQRHDTELRELNAICFT